MIKRKQKAPPEPEFYTSSTNDLVVNYRVYYMKVWEKLLYIIAAFVVGAAVGMIFYGGIGLDPYGEPTTLTYICNAVIICVAGFGAAFLFLPMRTQQIIDKRKRTLSLQFRDLLECLATSLSSGKNVTTAVQDAYQDLQIQYNESSYIMQELQVILHGLDNNVNIEGMLVDLGRRSGIEDIETFGNIFEICFRKGGNLKDVVRRTYDIISDKMMITQEIETKLVSNKNTQKIMLVMPIALVAMMKLSNPDFAKNFASPTGIMATTAAIGIFIFSYFLGQKILKIEV